MCSCRDFERSQRSYGNFGTHTEVITDFVCPLCFDSKKIFAFHGNDWDYFGSQYECVNCHKYIKSCEENGDIHHETFYLLYEINDFYIDNIKIHPPSKNNPSRSHCEGFPDYLGKVFILKAEYPLKEEDQIELPYFKFDKSTFEEKFKTYLLFS